MQKNNHGQNSTYLLETPIYKTGTIPNTLGACSLLEQLELHNNSFVGELSSRQKRPFITQAYVCVSELFCSQ